MCLKHIFSNPGETSERSDGTYLPIQPMILPLFGGLISNRYPCQVGRSSEWRAGGSRDLQGLHQRERL